MTPGSRDRETATDGDIALPSRVIDGIYDAALDGSLWQDVIAEVSAAFGGKPATVLVNDIRTGSVPLFAAAGLEPWSMDLFRKDYSTVDRNPVIPAVMVSRPGKALHVPDLLGENRYHRCAVYNDLMRPQGVKSYLTSVALRTGNTLVGFEVFERPGQRRPAERESILFESATQHIGRALRLSGSLGDTSARLKGLEATLDRLDTGVFLVDRLGRPSWQNKAAAELLRRNDGLFLKLDRLASADPGDDRALLMTLARPMDGMVRIARPSGGRPFILDLHRLWNSLGAPGASFAVFVSDPDADRLTPSRIAVAFDLTDAEARTALAVSRSRGIAEAATALGLSPNTVKTTLQRVFTKTGTHSQAELARLLERI